MNIHIKRYDKLIKYYTENPKTGYNERHHIIPKCMGGKDDADNLVLLPAKAHFIAHYLLFRAYPENHKLAKAFSMMTVNNKHQDRKQTGRLYELSKIARSNSMKGIPRPEWVKAKLRVPKKNKQNYKNLGRGRKLSQETKDKISKARRKNPLSEKQYKAIKKMHKDRSDKKKVLSLKLKAEFENFEGTIAEFAIYKNINKSTMKGYLYKTI